MPRERTHSVASASSSSPYSLLSTPPILISSYRSHQRKQVSISSSATLTGKPSQTPQVPRSHEGIYVVAQILARSIHRGSALNGTQEYHYLVRWEGYGPADDTWEVRSNLMQNASALVGRFDATGESVCWGRADLRSPLHYRLLSWNESKDLFRAIRPLDANDPPKSTRGKGMAHRRTNQAADECLARDGRFGDQALQVWRSSATWRFTSLSNCGT